MKHVTDLYNPEISKGDQIAGFQVKRIKAIPDMDSFFYELEHILTGARYIHVSNKDQENTFGIAFKTVPQDSTGIAHILEHTVLCGSKKYPVRDPFFSMIKRSLSTFMNAFTSSDWTMYPFSTQNKKDFYNLMDVYLDSVFNPKINELSFKQEGHRIEIERKSDDTEDFSLVYKGVVYNEMKGAMSSPDQILVRSIMNALYPDTTYSNNSGGDPKDIPKLTHDALKAFHQRHYHPSNAFFYTFGNFPLVEHLTFINNTYLKTYQKIDPQTDVPSQPKWSKPKKVTYTYPLDNAENPQKKYQICLAWLTADIRDLYEILILSLLEQILIGNPASPLRKKLIDSGLGSNLSDGSGFDTDLKDTLFTCGLKDVEEGAETTIEKMINEVFVDLKTNGIQQELIDAALHQIEFHRKEITNTPYPYGIKILLSISGTWFHGGDVVRVLQIDKEISRLKTDLKNKYFLTDKINQYFIENPHYIVFKLAPDHEMAQKEEDRVRQELSRIKANLKSEERVKFEDDANKLKELQEMQEKTDCLPTLQISDIPPGIKIIDETSSHNDGQITCYAQPTSGIFYFSLVSGIGKLEHSLLPWIPFFCYCFTKIGTQLHDYTEIAKKIDLSLGGIALSPQARMDFSSSPGCLPFLVLSSKCLNDNIEKLFQIVTELLCAPSFQNHDRLKNLLFEYRANLESHIVHQGHKLAISLASRNYSESTYLSELWHGVHQIKTIKDMAKDISAQKLAFLSQDLEKIAHTIFGAQNCQIAVVGEEARIQQGFNLSSGLIGQLPGHIQPAFKSLGIKLANTPPKEGWATSTSVSFVSKVLPVVRMNHEDAPALALIGKLLRAQFLHREIREKGGAYGGFSLYNSEEGLFCFGSYRDPHIVTTLNVFDSAKTVLNENNLTLEDIKEAMLQVCSDIDKPDPPGPSARKAYFRKLIGLTNESRARFKNQLLQLDQKKILNVYHKYFQADSINEACAIISNEEKLKTTNQTLSQSQSDLNRANLNRLDLNRI